MAFLYQRSFITMPTLAQCATTCNPLRLVYPKRRGLSATGGPKQADPRAVRDGKRQARESSCLAEIFGERIEFDGHDRRHYEPARKGRNERRG
jgi:hypothetical protein